MPLLDVYNIYDNVSKKRFGVTKLQADVNKLIIFKIMKESIYFRYDDMHTWYFKGRRIRMGEIPVLPRKMRKLAPEYKKGLNIVIKCKMSEEVLELTTNLPIGFKLLVKINGDISSKIVEITDNKLEIKYKENIETVELSSVISTCQPIGIQELIGEMGRNLIGEFIKFDSVNGNQVFCKF